MAKCGSVRAAYGAAWVSAVILLIMLLASASIGTAVAGMAAERAAGGHTRMPAQPASDPFGGVWVALTGGNLSGAAMGIVSLSGPRPKRGPECRLPGRCEQSEQRMSLALDRSPPLGPLDTRGFSLFTSVAGQRIYAFPQPTKGERRSWEDDWAWGIGARIDTLPLIKSEPSSERLFALADVGVGMADEPVDETDYRLRARVLVGTSRNNTLICGFGELGAGLKDPSRPAGGGLFGRAGVEVRF